MNKEEMLSMIENINHIRYCQREVDKKRLIEIIEEFDDDYEEFDFEGLCFLSVLDDNELEQLEEIFEEVDFYA